MPTVNKFDMMNKDFFTDILQNNIQRLNIETVGFILKIADISKDYLHQLLETIHIQEYIIDYLQCE